MILFFNPYFFYIFPNDNLFVVLIGASAILAIEITMESKHPFPHAVNVPEEKLEDYRSVWSMLQQRQVHGVAESQRRSI